MKRWVLLRGLTRESGHWASFARALERHSHEEVIPLDLPGNGLRWRERTPASVPAIAAALRAQLPPGPPAVLLAMSLGGMIAVEWCRSAPQGIAGCVLLNSSAASASPPWQRLRPSQYPTLARLLASGHLAGREEAILRMTSARPDAQAAVLAEWVEFARLQPVSRANAMRQLWAAARYRPGGAPPVPTLLLASAGDRLVSPRCSQALAAKWGCELRLHPWAGHDLPLDDPAWVLAQAAGWAAQLAR